MKIRYIKFIGLIFLVFNSFAIDYNYEAVEAPEDSFAFADFRINIPEDMGFIQGIYFYCPLYYGDTRSYTTDTVTFHCALERDFVIMGAHLENADMSGGTGDALLDALDAIADSSGHQELAHAPIFLQGLSWAGQWSYHFTMHYHERVIGFITIKGGIHDSTFSMDHIGVPGYMFIGELDSDYRLRNLTGIFEEHRPFGAVWTLALEQNSGHSGIYDRDFLDTYFHSIVTLRLPDWSDDTLMELLEIDESAGYLGDRTSMAIGQWACFDEPMRNVASWLPDRENAIYWQEFVSESLVTDTIACTSALVEEKHIESDYYTFPNPFIDYISVYSNSGIVGIYDIYGKQTEACNNNLSYIWQPSAHTPAGIYFVHFNSKNEPPQKIILIK